MPLALRVVAHALGLPVVESYPLGGRFYAHPDRTQPGVLPFYVVFTLWGAFYAIFKGGVV